MSHLEKIQLRKRLSVCEGGEGGAGPAGEQGQAEELVPGAWKQEVSRLKTSSLIYINHADVFSVAT